jgi:hypothetical protein
MPERIYTRAEADALGAAPRIYTRAEADALGAVDPNDQQLQTGVEHASNTATFGASNEIAKGFYQGTGAARTPEEAQAQISARTAANPGSALVGDLAGFMTPGPGLVGKVAREAGGLVKGGKFATRAVTGGTEGGIFGLSAAMNEDHMGDSRLAAENIAAGVFGGALGGMGLHTVFGAVGDLGKSALVKAFGGVALKEKLGKAAEDALMASLGGDTAPARQNEVARFAFDNKLVDRWGSVKASAGKAKARAAESFQEVQKHLDIADTMGSFDPAKAADRMQVEVDKLAQNPAMIETRAKLQKFVDRFRDLGVPGRPEVPARAGVPEVPGTRTIPAIPEVPAMPPRPGTKHRFTENTDPKKPPLFVPGEPAFPGSPAIPGTPEVPGTYRPGIAATPHIPATPGVPGEAPITFNKAWETITSPQMKRDPDMYRLRGELQDEIFKQAEQVDPKLASLRAANRENANALEFRTLAENKADKQSNELIGAPLGLITHGPAGALYGAGLKMARNRGGFMAASALDALAQNGTLPKIAQGFQLLMKTRLANPGFGGPFRAVLETAAAKGAEALLQTHLSLAQQDPEYMMHVGLEHEDPQTISAHTDRANRLSQLGNSVDAAGAVVDQHVARVLGGQPGRAPNYTSSPPTREQFDATVKKLELLVSNSENNHHLADLAPITSSLAQMATQAGATYLLGKAPKNPTAGLPPALQRPWNPSRVELRDWIRMVDTVANPLSALDAMRQGTSHADQIETLKTVYPRLFSEMQEKMQARLSAWTAPLDRRTKAQVGALVGDLNNPAVTQLIQAAHQRAIPPPAPPPDGRQKIDADKNMQTQAQRLEDK